MFFFCNPSLENVQKIQPSPPPLLTSGQNRNPLFFEKSVKMSRYCALLPLSPSLKKLHSGSEPDSTCRIFSIYKKKSFPRYMKKKIRERERGQELEVENSSQRFSRKVLDTIFKISLGHKINFLEAYEVIDGSYVEGCDIWNELLGAVWKIAISRTWKIIFRKDRVITAGTYANFVVFCNFLGIRTLLVGRMAEGRGTRSYFSL